MLHLLASLFFIAVLAGSALSLWRGLAAIRPALAPVAPAAAPAAAAEPRAPAPAAGLGKTPLAA